MNGNVWKWVVIAVACIGFYIFITLCPFTTAHTGEMAKRTQCMNNISAIGKCIKLYQMDNNDNYPSNLNAFLKMNYIDSPRLFICPSSGHKAGSLSNVTEWTDYTFNFSIPSNASPDTIIGYCRPENHKNKGCNVLYADNSIKWRTKEELEKEMKKTQQMLDSIIYIGPYTDFDLDGIQFVKYAGRVIEQTSSNTEKPLEGVSLTYASNASAWAEMISIYKKGALVMQTDSHGIFSGEIMAHFYKNRSGGIINKGVVPTIFIVKKEGYADVRLPIGSDQTNAVIIMKKATAQ